MLFLLPSPRGLTKLRNALREVAALEVVQRDYASQLDDEQSADLKTRLNNARGAVTGSLGSAYTHLARMDGQTLAVVALSEAKPTLSEHLQAAPSLARLPQSVQLTQGNRHRKRPSLA